MIDKFMSVYALIFSREIFVRWHKLLYKISLSGLGVLNYKNDRISGELHFLKNYISKASGAVIDVGGNEGQYAKNVRGSNKTVAIYSFEPHPKTYSRLVANTAGMDVFAINKGVSSCPGHSTLYDYAERDGSSHASLYENVIKEIHSSKGCVAHEVSVTTVDEFVEENNIPHIALLKIDVEGHEYEVLKGAEGTILAGKVSAIHFEFNEMNVASRVYFHDFWKMLDGYKFYRLLSNGMYEIKNYNAVMCEVFAYQNIVAFKK